MNICQIGRSMANWSMARALLRAPILALVLCLAALAAPAAAQQPANPLVGEWHLDGDQRVDPNDNESPRFTPDSSPSGRDIVYGQGGAAYSFPGRFDGFLSSDNPLTAGVLSNYQRVTVIAWIRASSFPESVRVIAGRGVNGVACEAMPYALRYQGGASDEGASFSIRRPNGSSVSSPLSGPLADDEWHMLAGTFDGSRVRLYVDGIQEGTGTLAGTPTIGYGAGGGAFGIDGYAGSACPVAVFSGGIDEVREYNRALTPFELGRIGDPNATSPPELELPPPPTPPPASGQFISRFTISDKTPGAFTPVTLDARSSVTPAPVRRFDWDITGDGKTDVSCDPQTPVFTTNTLKPSTRSVGLTVVDSSGASRTTTTAISPSTGTLPPKVRSAAKATGVSATLLSGTKTVGGLCSPASPSAVSTTDTTANRGPAPGCVAQVVYGSFKAVGCWQRVTDVSKLPGAERATVDSNFRDTVFSESVEKSLNATVKPGTLLKPPGSVPKKEVLGKRARARASASIVEYALLIHAIVDNAAYVADGTVRVNGLDVTPTTLGGVKRHVVFVGGGLLKTGKASLTSTAQETAANSPFGKLAMKKGKLLENFGVGDTNSPLGALRIPSKLKLVPGLGIRGDVSATMDHYKLKIAANVSLPDLLAGTSASANLEASTDKGLELDYFKFFAKQAPLGPVELNNMQFEWKGGSEKSLTAGLEATILNQVRAGGTIRFEHGNFRYLKAFAESFPGIVIAPPDVHLTRVDAEYDANGPVIQGAGTFTLGPNPGGQGCPKVGVVGSLKIDFNWPITVSAQGRSQLLCFTIATLGASLNEYGYGTFFGRFNPDLSPLPLSLDANIGGIVQAPIGGRRFGFQINMDVTGCVDFGTYTGKRVRGCIAGYFLASDYALAFCADFGWVEAGIRVFYPPVSTLANPVLFVGAVLANSKILVPGCNVGDYGTRAIVARGSQAGSQAFSLPAGRKDTVVAFKGRGGAPDLVLHGPGGRTIDVPSQDIVHNGSYVAFRLDYDDTTYVIIRAAQPGRWTATLKPGSPAIASIGTATELPPIKLKASVKRSGAKRVLRYRINKRKGQSVRFAEVAGPKAGQLLGETKRARGRIRFTPAESRTRTHVIKATVLQNGAPRKSFTVARFRASLPKIGRARKLKARRRGRTLIVTWRAAKNAQKYRVFVTLSDGRKLYLTPRRRRVVVRKVAKTTKGTVVVIGRRASRLGRRSTLRVKAVKAKKKKRSKAKRKR